MNSKLNTHWKRVHSMPEINSGEILVDPAGYITKKKRIEQMIQAGERLAEIRKEMYQEEHEGPDPVISPLHPLKENDPVDLEGYVDRAVEVAEKLKKGKKELTGDTKKNKLEVIEDDGGEENDDSGKDSS